MPEYLKNISGIKKLFLYNAYKKHLKDIPELALTDDNLISLCGECHEYMHPEKHRKKIGYRNEERW